MSFYAGYILKYRNKNNKMTRLAEYRHVTGLTQEELARRVGSSQQGVAWFERHGIRRRSAARRYARALNIGNKSVEILPSDLLESYTY